MKNVIRQLKKSFGLEEAENNHPEDRVQPEKNNRHSFSGPVSAEKRESVIRFIMEGLKPFVDEKSQVVGGIRLYFLCTDLSGEETLRIALYADNPQKFQEEYLERKMLNHYIRMAPHWFLEYQFVKDRLPENILVKGNMGLEIIRKGQIHTGTYNTAVLKVLAGKTEQDEYLLDPSKQLKYYIGRTKNPQLSSGKIRHNDIAFLGRDETGYDEKTTKANLHVSRNHAYILYNTQLKKFFLYADKGGLPENGNKLKVHTSSEQPVSLTIPGLAHELRNGDQIELGGEAILLFSELNPGA